MAIFLLGALHEIKSPITADLLELKTTGAVMTGLLPIGGGCEVGF